MSGFLERYEQPPRTEHEWEVALKDYARDLDEAYDGDSGIGHDIGCGEEIIEREESPTVKSTAQQVFPPEKSPSGRTTMNTPHCGLSHRARSSDSIDGVHPHERGRISPVQSMHIQRSKSYTTLSTHSFQTPTDRSGDIRSVISDIGFKQMMDRDFSPHELGLVSSINKPRGHVFDEDEESNSSVMERQAMRKFYVREGWLRSPRPSKATVEARKGTVRNLGLSSVSDCAKRKGVVSEFMDMAKIIFQTSNAGVSIMHAQNDQIYFSGDSEPIVVNTQQTACGHALGLSEEKITAIADLGTDWRFSNYDRKGNLKFYASAPLVYPGYKGRHVAFGTLCIYDTEARDSFDKREEDLLLRLANMAVRQLATLHSEMMANRAREMYEQNIAFLRRSLIVPLPKDPESSCSIPRPRSKIDQVKKEPGASCTLAPHTFVKSGPKGSKTNKGEGELADQHFFDDAAKTVQGILKSDSVALVGLEDFHLFLRRSGPTYSANFGPKDRKVDMAEVILGFTQGEAWPAGVDPVVTHAPTGPEIRLLGRSGVGSYHFDRSGAGQEFSQVIRTYIKSRHFWWDREEQDEVSLNLMGMMPAESRTTFMATKMTSDGALRIAVLASWNKPPDRFSDHSRMALPFSMILGGSIMAAMSVRKVRSLEQSQISNNNLQAHELRTPLHQILATTQTLRSHITDLASTSVIKSSNSPPNMQQARDLLPMLDAIETSSKMLHGILENILSFLDLKGKDNMLAPSTSGLLTSPSGTAESLEVMFEGLMEEACEEDKRVRAVRGQLQSSVETIFEIDPALQGEQFIEDGAGALRTVLRKILSNAYKFIESQGYVEIYVDNITYRQPSETCVDLSPTSMISVMIVDSGKGMEQNFVREKLGEPWAKEDRFVTGSGLSVHLAWQIIENMGGIMEISSAPGSGCTVKIEVPVSRRKDSVSNTQTSARPDSLYNRDTSHLVVRPDTLQGHRHIALLGFGLVFKDHFVRGLTRLGKVLIHSIVNLGCQVTTIERAEVVIVDGRMEEISPSFGARSLYHWLDRIRAEDIVILIAEDHKADPEVLNHQRELGKRIRRYRKPVTPAIFREILSTDLARQRVTELFTPRSSIRRSINSEETTKCEEDAIRTDENGSGSDSGSNSQTPKGYKHSKNSAVAVKRPFMMDQDINELSSAWKPKGMPIEDAVTPSCLSDYFSSRHTSTMARSHSNTSPGHAVGDSQQSLTSTPALISEGHSDQMPTPAVNITTPTTDQEDIEGEIEVESESGTVKVMVVEDNIINRKILVRMLSKRLNMEVLEAEDGVVAVELFRELTSPVIVLLDINMPNMDGYQASTEMRSIEEQTGRKRSHIIAVTALASDIEKQIGLVECGMDKWLTKPCDRSTVMKQVEEARKALLREFGL